MQEGQQERPGFTAYDQCVLVEVSRIAPAWSEERLTRWSISVSQVCSALDTSFAHSSNASEVVGSTYCYMAARSVCLGSDFEKQILI